MALYLTAAGTFVAGFLASLMLQGKKPALVAPPPVTTPTPAPPAPGAAPVEPAANDSDSDYSDEEDGAVPYKMVFLVRTDLKMEKGKTCAQVGHATLGAYKRALKKHLDEVKRWEKQGQAKIAIKVTSEEQMSAYTQNTFLKQAEAANLNTYVVVDAGRTQIASGSRTVLAIGPAPVAEIDKITRKLPLL